MQLATMLANTSFIAAVPQLVAQHHSRTLNETIPVLDGSLTRFAARKTPLYEQQNGFEAGRGSGCRPDGLLGRDQCQDCRDFGPYCMALVT